MGRGRRKEDAGFGETKCVAREQGYLDIRDGSNKLKIAMPNRRYATGEG